MPCRCRINIVDEYEREAPSKEYLGRGEQTESGVVNVNADSSDPTSQHDGPAALHTRGSRATSSGIFQISPGF